ncbi:GNAT family N-acetyltransferase [Caballeronia sp. LZ001]|uniref:GNAT family N-acetyltransferase n=1 Tax=Caballeronia sp. LZ001 TaxID=3038553 RepID=UPI002864F45D|nr:GNAT family N-acetyltransferase [Caballeronia sp. LZ001]MDR5798568.1 GNAT family N-acetyltransferase [Caballeronia sp. LZ001]
MFKENEKDPVRAMAERVSLTNELIAQIPTVHSFYQIFDPRVEDALAFGLKGFTVSTRYTLQFPVGRTVEDLWKGLHYKTRNMVRTGQKFVTIQPLAPDEFNRFYDSNLEARSRKNIYGSQVMHRLVTEFTQRGAGYVLGAYNADGALVAAIGVAMDSHAAYYILSSRTQNAHGGAISVLVWEAIKNAAERNLTFDFDGIPNENTFKFLSGFRPTLKPRLVIERHSPIWSAAKAGWDYFAEVGPTGSSQRCETSP